MNNNNRNAHAPHDDSSHKLLTDTRERYFWQSRAGLRDPPELVDIPALVRAIRA